VSALQQFFSACILALLLVWPLWLAAYFGVVEFRQVGRGGMLLPPFLFGVSALFGLFCQLFLVFLRGREAGALFFLKIGAFYSAAPLLLLLLLGSALLEPKEPYVPLALLLAFCAASAVVASTIKVISERLSRKYKTYR
jgi:asparagine N-glycosylation enzyme membrane subunit Stt3